jgi:hypothetical protein
MVNWDIAKLKARSVHERRLLWQRAKEKMATSEEAKALFQLIESSGLDYAKDKIQPISLDSPTGRLMKRIIGSEAGAMAMLEATRQGLPALAGVDPLLQAGLGDKYSRHNDATVQAGYLVKGFMEGLGYQEFRAGPMPEACIAKTGLMFKPQKNP